MTSKIVVKLLNLVDCFDDAIPLLKANWKESGNPFELDVNSTKLFYTYMDSLGCLFIAGAYLDGKAVGYCVTTVSPHPLNNSIKICNVDGIYLIPELRGGRASVKLMNAVRGIAKGYKANIIHWHAPAGSKFSETLAARFTPLSNYFREEL